MSTADWALVMTPATAENVARAAPAGTVIEAGTVNSGLLLDSAIAAPPVGAGVESVTVHVAEVLLARLSGAQTNELMVPGTTKETAAVWELPLYAAVRMAD